MTGQDSLPFDDRGLAYGEGVFETMRARKGCLPLLGYHLDRMRAGLVALGIPLPDESTLRESLADAATRQPNGIVKLIVTAGSGGQGYRRSASPAPRCLVQALPAPSGIADWHRLGMRVRICQTRVEGPSALAGLKHLNRLSQVLARAEWNDEFDEGLMRDREGRLVEGVRTNLFACRNGALLTPPIDSGVSGVMRRLVLELAQREGIETEERFLTDEEITTADELFLTNSVIGVCRIRHLEDQEMPAGTMTRLLQAGIEDELEHRTC